MLTPSSPAESSLSDDENEDGDSIDDAAVGRSFSFPDLDERIRKVIKEYGAVFPKLNFSSPKVRLFHGCQSPFTSNRSLTGCIVGVTTIFASQMHSSIRRLPFVEIVRFRITRPEYRYSLRGVSVRCLESTSISTRACLAEMVSYRQEPRVPVFRS